MVPSLRLFVSVHMGIELFLGFEGPGIDTRHHDVARIAAPIGAGEAAELEGIPRDGLGGIYVGPFAHIHEGAIAVKGQLREVVAPKERFRIFPLVGLAHLLEASHSGVVGEVFAVEALALLNDFPHAPFDFREIRIGQGLGQQKVVVKTVVDGRTEAQRRTWAQLQHGLGQDVG